jgi:hypothetical protein
MKKPTGRNRLMTASLRRTRARSTRRTPVEAAAEKLVDAIAVLVAHADLEGSDMVAFEDARAAVEKFRRD